MHRWGRIPQETWWIIRLHERPAEVSLYPAGITAYRDYAGCGGARVGNLDAAMTGIDRSRHIRWLRISSSTNRAAERVEAVRKFGSKKRRAGIGARSASKE